jgi:hypothetical protein
MTVMNAADGGDDDADEVDDGDDGDDRLGMQQTASVPMNCNDVDIYSKYLQLRETAQWLYN